MEVSGSAGYNKNKRKVATYYLFPHKYTLLNKFKLHFRARDGVR